MSGTRPLRVAAVDLGASSGRVMVGTVGPDLLDLEEVHRFRNGAVEVDGALTWDVRALHAEVLAGLRAAAAGGPVDGVGIDSWAVDYGLLDTTGELVGPVVAYRDSRTDGVRERVVEVVPEEELYATTGLQQLPFNTLYQLVSAPDLLGGAETMLLVPDLLAYWLTGQVGAERTNASTTQLYDVRGRDWATGLAEKVGVPARILPPLRDPGTTIGSLLPDVSAAVGLPAGTPVVAVGSHDTASAVVGVPFTHRSRAAYISSGTWSLVGVELDEPVLSDAAREADFTNEGGVDRTIRFLRNVSGLWVLSEAIRTWESRGEDVGLADLLAEAAAVPALRSVVDLEAPEFLPPGDMEARIAAACAASGQPVPGTRAEVARCVLDSLALAYRRVVRRAAALSGVGVEVVHVVGGGARNELLCALTASACGVPVLAGPVEAAALGNVLVQARALGADLPDLAAMRALVRATHELVRHEPAEVGDWDAAERAVRG
ncbi:rhamnulokinase [Nocardioides iriomotensis]|uniref:Rhamnulokinase n=1 Tax=Nocardioides iriomotensis TaxID=715784 RepID=A0A4Q5J506_9ACTN|nr:rhamnulokinase family protein [Nocardioides iriomotensis]RYU13722.1 rhamnulokinase [Nocardioides iriomotensis]